MTASVGYADLARLFGRLAVDERLEAARLLGFQRVAVSPDRAAMTSGGGELVGPRPAAPAVAGDAGGLAATARPGAGARVGPRLAAPPAVASAVGFARVEAAAERAPEARVRHPRIGPAGLTACAVTSDGRRVVSGAEDGTLTVRDLTGRVLASLEGHADYVNACAVTPDDRRVISASWDRTLKVWDLGTGRLLVTLEGHTSGVAGCAATPDARRVVSASWDRTLRVWDLDTGRSLAVLAGHADGVTACAVTPEGRRVVSASSDGALRVWELETGRSLAVLAGHTDGVTACAVTPDGRRVVSAAMDLTLKVWDLHSGRLLTSLVGHTGYVNACAVTRDGRSVVSASDDRTIRVWDLETGRLIAVFEGHTHWVTGCAVLAERVVSVSKDRTLKVWGLERDHHRAVLEGHTDWVTACAVAPDGRRAVSASKDRTVKVWDLHTGGLVASFHSDAWVNGLAVTPDGRGVVTASDDRTLKVWDLQTGRLLASLDGHDNWVNACAVSPDGRVVSGSRDRTLKVWDLGTGSCLATLRGHGGGVTACAVVPGRRRVVSASDDGTLKVWDLDAGDCVATLRGHTSGVMGCAVTVDGRHVVSASHDLTLKVWDIDGGPALASLEGHTSSVTACAVTADGHAVSASHDRTLKVWQLGTGRHKGRLLASLERHTRGLTGCAVTPDGRRVISASLDATLRVWDLRRGNLLIDLADGRGDTLAAAPDGSRPCLTRQDLQSVPGAALPPSPPLVAWSVLWSRLHGALHEASPGRDPDVHALVRTWARGECLRRIPRRERRTWAAAASVWIDRSSRLTPFWDDQAMVVRQLVRLCGVTAVEPRVLDDSLQATYAAWYGDFVGPHPPDRGAPVLVLGDLGFYGTASDRAYWLRTARRLRRDGRRVAALVPCPPSHWDGALARAWNAMPWERASGPHGRGTPEERAAALLRLVAPTALAQPGLVRALRRLLPAADADASTEVDVWRHRDVLVADVSGLVLKAEASTHWREQFAAEVPARLQAEVSRLIDRWHGSWRAELIHSETLTWIAHGIPRAPGRPAEAREFVDKIAATLCSSDGDSADLAMVRRYSRCLLDAFPDRGYAAVPQLKTVWSVAFADVADARLPRAIAPSELFVHAAHPDRRWIAHQRGASLVLAPDAADGAAADRESSGPVAAIVAATPEVWVQRGNARATRTPLVAGAEIPIYPGEHVTLRSDRSEVTLGIWQPEAWAVTAGRDRYGLWAAFELCGVVHRMRWIPPGRFLMGSPPTEIGHRPQDGPQHWVTIPAGYWLGETVVTQALWRVVMSKTPSRFVADERPVELVSWDDCQAFIGRLNRALDGLATRLPTEAEWERACRAGTTAAAWTGDLTLRGENHVPELDAIAWYSGNSGTDFELPGGHDSSGWREKQYAHRRAGTHPVGRKLPNPYGLHDMLGNVFEWCQDDYLIPPLVGPIADENVGEAGGSLRVCRGGSWNSNATQARAASRVGYMPNYRSSFIGFRLVGEHVSVPSKPGGPGRLRQPGGRAYGAVARY